MYSAFARVDRAEKCQRCQRPFSTGEIVVEIAESNPTYRVADGPWLHVLCAIDVSSWAANALFRADPLEFAERAPLAQLAYDRQRAIEWMQMRPRVRAAAGPMPVIEPARDPFGRPRVRVLIGGSGSPYVAFGDAAPLRILGVAGYPDGFDGTIVSPLREYVLAGQGTTVNLRVDPSQPFIGSVLVMNSLVTISGSYRRRVAEWLTLGLGPPVLWVLSNPKSRNDSSVDEFVGRLRVLVDGAGYTGDDCPVMVTDGLSRKGFAQLAAMLDEHARPPGENESDSAYASVRAAKLLEKMVAEKNENAIGTALSRAQKSARVALVAERKSMADNAVLALAFDKHRVQALTLLQALKLKLPHEALMLEINRVIDHKQKPLSKEFEMLTELLIASGHAELLGALLKEKLTDKSLTKARRHALDHALVSCAVALA